VLFIRPSEHPSFAITVVKVKCAISDESCRRGAHLPFLGREPVRG